VTEMNRLWEYKRLYIEMTQMKGCDTKNCQSCHSCMSRERLTTGFVYIVIEDNIINIIGAFENTF
jgi:hypothetical protein